MKHFVIARFGESRIVAIHFMFFGFASVGRCFAQTLRLCQSLTMTNLFLFLLSTAHRLRQYPRPLIDES